MNKKERIINEVLEKIRREQAAKIVRDSMPQVVKDVIDGKYHGKEITWE